MRIRPFEYHAANDLGEALELTGRYGPDAKVLAGGTDLVLDMKHKTKQPPHVISLCKVKELDYIRPDESTIRVGSTTRLADVAANPALRKNFPILCEAAGLIGSWQIRNVGTIGGNLCQASPSADSAAALLALNAKVVISEVGRQKELPLTSFFSGPGKTVLKPNQLLTEIILKIPKNKSAGNYLKLMRKKAVDLSLVGVAFQAEADPAGKTISSVAIGLGGVAPTPIRASEAEAELAGLSYGEVMSKIPQVTRLAVAATKPISDIRASAEYRRTIVELYVRRAADKVLGSLLNGTGEGR